ncbi:unnamed protein product, partial [Rotaria socialis]
VGKLTQVPLVLLCNSCVLLVIMVFSLSLLESIRAAVTANKAQKQTPIRINSFRLMTDETMHTDDDQFVKTSIQIRQVQGTFPSSFCTAVYLAIEMLEDEETFEKY